MTKTNETNALQGVVVEMEDFSITRPNRRQFLGLGLTIGSGAMLWPIFSPLAEAQVSGVFCAAQFNKELVSLGEKLNTLGEIKSEGGYLRGVVDLTVLKRAVTYYQGNGGYVCFRPSLRSYQAYRGWNVDPANRVLDPAIAQPGPTLRVKVGDKVELVFLNRINRDDFNLTALTSGKGGTTDVKSAPNKCDTAFNSSGGQAYPGDDAARFPNCFHASNTSNLHFHGTHTTPGSFGDNVLIGVIPDPAMDPNAAIETAKKLYAAWEGGKNPANMNEEPTKGLIAAAQARLQVLYDAAVAKKDNALATQIQDAIHTNHELMAAGEWPQYWPGFYPHFFDLPRWSGSLKKFPMMGQSPGTHWYHCHQHGSTTLQLLNGMAGMLLVTDDSYDGKLKSVGNGKIKEKVMILQLFQEQPNQINVSPSSNTIAVNGQVAPVISMKIGEVQWWRIANATMRSHGVGDYLFFDEATYNKIVKDPSLMKVQSGRFAGKQAAPPPIDTEAVPHLFQTAQDGVQLAWENYDPTGRAPVTGTQLAPGNRADFMVKAPSAAGNSYLVFWPSSGGPPAAKDIRNNLVLKVVTAEKPNADTNTVYPTKRDQYPVMPDDLADITDKEIDGKHRTVTFSMLGGPGQLPVFKIDGEQFKEGRIDQLMLLGDAEEWTLVNTSVNSIMHPFHIHINPFQVTEIYDPLTMWDSVAKRPNPQKFPVRAAWWDVIAIPAGVQEVVVGTDKDGNATYTPVFLDPPPPGAKDTTGYNLDAKLDERGPGYVKIRSRFVDFPGKFVLHCHILGHEDRGMMQMVEVKDNKTVVRHH